MVIDSISIVMSASIYFEIFGHMNHNVVLAMFSDVYSKNFLIGTVGNVTHKASQVNWIFFPIFWRFFGGVAFFGSIT
jgi:hypothetical protein